MKTNLEAEVMRNMIALSTMILWLPLLAAAFLLLPSSASAQSATVTDDAFLSTNSTTQQVNLNGQGISLLVAGSSATVGSLHVGTTKSFIKFQLQSSLPPATASANVAKATLKLFLSPATSPNGAMDIYPVTGDWSESTLNPSSPPAIASTAFATMVPVGKANSFLVLDVTQLVQAWLKGGANGGLDNHGIALVADTATSYVVFDSKESIVTSHEPRLEIVLVSSGPQGSAGPQGPQGPAGSQGATGSAGAQGAAATVQAGTTLTVSAGTPASVLNSGTPNAAVLNFLIPQGPSGATGASGPPGINNKGNWIGAASYNPSDAVFSSSSYWLATTANSNSLPATSNSNWQLLAAGINNRGAWDTAANYSGNDAVSDGGSYWLALAANNASQPSPTNTNWQQLAAAGAPGVTGTQGNTGPQGPKGDQGLIGLPGLPGLPGQNPVGAALTTTSNTFAGNQTVNGSLILGGPGSGIQFADGTQQNTAVTGASSGVPPGFMILGISPTPPAGYSRSGAITIGNTWFSVASLPTARGYLAAATLNGKIYAIGGSTASANVNSMDVFDPSTNTWSAAAPMPTARANLAAAVVNGKIYAIGGFGGPDVVQVYDTKSDNWSPVASLITGRTSLATAVVNGRIYAIGGRDSNNNFLDTVEVYDPGADTWTPVSSMSFARSNLAAASVNGKIYAMGGIVSKVGIVFFVEAYDPATDTWSSVAHMPVGPATLGAATVSGKIYAIGGQFGVNAALNSVQVYDPTTDSWNQAAPMSVARGNLGVAEANGLIYAVGGTDTSGTVLNSVQQYSPPVTIYTFIKN